ncbi:hypothetical protein BDZ94DRAFT_1258693 [Collybia nuda]|uniref:Uncharacterized protein n=1 Tax=Collybia nuda TaxID=64659 RepID=A0A9P5Y9J0_9AGAR|nr:hypothetical protein BDZ94DRAFT_1258693 [Collybia nuda]
MLPILFEVMKLVYRHYDPAKAPVDIDLTKNKGYLTYETAEWDPFNPVRATLHLEEVRGKSTRIHFLIDLLYPCIRDQVTRKQHRTPPDVFCLLEELKSYVNETLKSRRASREIGYYRRLLNNNLLSREEFRRYRGKESGSGWGGTCPVCSNSANGTGSQLIACVLCGTLGCAKNGCRGYDINGIVQSVNNPGETYCRPCNGTAEHARLVPCHQCHARWFNPRRHPMCVGRPGYLIDINLPTMTGGLIFHSLKKSFKVPSLQHPPTMAPCGECWGEDNSEWLSCGNPTCWSIGGVVCKACSPSGGTKCAGGRTWFCDECANQLSSSRCRDKGNEEQIERDLEAIFGPRGYLKLQGSGQLTNSGQLQIFS